MYKIYCVFAILYRIIKEKSERKWLFPKKKCNFVFEYIENTNKIFPLGFLCEKTCKVLLKF